MLQWLKKLFGLFDPGHDVDELARRLQVPVEQLTSVEPSYRQFTIAKRSGGTRQITAPNAELKRLQRTILRRLLGGLRTHPAAMGFESGESFVTNAARHCGKAVVVHLDIRDFFPSISADRVGAYFRFIGWNRQAARLLTRLVTYDGCLPQGAPTSPRLSNLVNYRLDTRLASLAATFGGVYTRYADDITLSLEADDSDVRSLLGIALSILRDEGYEPHLQKKLSVRRRHHQQRVTGLVVNDRVHLPRKTRRWLRAVEHRMASQDRSVADPNWRPVQKPTLTPAQLDAWRGLVAMIERQRS